jgi:hypothetical protein
MKEELQRFRGIALLTRDSEEVAKPSSFDEQDQRE